MLSCRLLERVKQYRFAFQKNLDALKASQIILFFYYPISYYRFLSILEKSIIFDFG